MKKICLLAAVAAFVISPAIAATKPADAQPTVQAQIAALQQQVATLQKQVESLKSHNQPVCISLWCGTVVSSQRTPT
jgi:peptidoglycan hydrolase CwlO-like protein